MTWGLARPERGLALAGALLMLVGCASAPSSGPAVAPHEHDSGASSDARPGPNEQEAYERALPVFERYCASCHTSRSGERVALGHFTMDRYPFDGHHADQISSTIREVLGANGRPATMPKGRPGAVQGEELRIVLDWAEAFDRAHAAANHGEQHREH